MQEGRHAAAQHPPQLQGRPPRAVPLPGQGQLRRHRPGRGGRATCSASLKLSGFLAWLAWLFIHIFFLIGFRNRALVLFHWAYSFLTFRRGARLITGVEHPEEVLRSAGHPAADGPPSRPASQLGQS